MFGCYRRDEAADPDTFVAAVTMVLSKYPAEIVEAVTDPYAGLPSRKTERGYSGLPDVADVKEACEDEADRAERIKRLGARYPIPRITGPKEHLANVFVPTYAPQYEAMLERSKTAPATEWRLDEKRPGIWVSLGWFEGPSAGLKRFRPFTDEELARLYPKRVNAAAEDAAQ